LVLTSWHQRTKDHYKNTNTTATITLSTMSLLRIIEGIMVGNVLSVVNYYKQDKEL